MAGFDDIKRGENRHTNSPKITKFRIGDEFLKILQDNTFNGINREDVTDHIARVLEITEWIKIPNVEKNVLRLHVFSKSINGDAEKWWNDEIEGKSISWNETCNKLCRKYYSISYSSSIKEFYVNERTKGAMGDLDDEPHNESYKKECSDTFYKPYLDTQDAKDIYEIIDREYTLIPIPAPHDIDNPDELCRTNEFIVVRHSIGNDEEFVNVSPSKICVVERTPSSMSCIYHELFRRKDCGWEGISKARGTKSNGFAFTKAIDTACQVKGGTYLSKINYATIMDCRSPYSQYQSHGLPLDTDLKLVPVSCQIYTSSRCALERTHRAPAYFVGSKFMWMIIILVSTKKELCIAFERLMHEKFQMSFIGELTFFLGLQVNAEMDGLFNLLCVVPGADTKSIQRFHILHAVKGIF
ncbi:hypothetical protein Tco_0662019 [Tanacetum coccineum]